MNSLVEGVKFFGPGKDNYNLVGIQIDGGQPTIKNSFFKNNYEGIFVKYTSGLILIEGNNFEENKYPVWSIPRAVFKSNQGQNNIYDGIFLSGYVSENLTLFQNPLPYATYDYQIIEVSQNQVLIIEPETIIKFGFRSRLEVKGQLIAQGTLKKLITFTSLDPSPGYWDYIYFYPSSTGSILENVVVENGGRDSWLYVLLPAIYIEDTQVTFNNLTLRNSAEAGFWLKNSQSIIKNAQIENNKYGMKILGSGKFPQLLENITFQNNSEYDIFIEDTNFCSLLPAYLKSFKTNCPP